MATAGNVRLTLNQEPEYYRPGILQESANTASELLQMNHEDHHIFFNKDGFHNHIAHHLLTIWALRADPEQIQNAYNINQSYQRLPEPLKSSVVADMSDPGKFKDYLGNEKYYHDYLEFFRQEMERSGWQSTVNKYLFAGTEQADDMLARLFAGFLVRNPIGASLHVCPKHLLTLTPTHIAPNHPLRIRRGVSTACYHCRGSCAERCARNLHAQALRTGRGGSQRAKW